MKTSHMASPSEEKENGSLDTLYSKKSTLNRDDDGNTSQRAGGEDGGMRSTSGTGPGPGPGPGEGYKRAAEVTSQLKARIEMMKVCSLPFCLPRTFDSRSEGDLSGEDLFWGQWADIF